METPILDVADIKVYYHTVLGEYRAVDGVSFTVNRGELFGLAGESGCGKSTLVEGLLRVIKPPGYIKSGKVMFKGTDLLGLDDESLRKIRWRQISYIPQGSMNSLNPVMRIEEQIVDAITAHEKTAEEEAKKRVASLLETVVLAPEVATMYPHELSGGMKQRVIIAMAMSLGPELIIADEPTTALDLSVQKVVLQSIAEVKEKLNATVMLVAHDMGVHAEMADRLAVMYAAKIVEVGDVYTIFNDPLHPYVRALVDATPSLEEKRALKGVPGIAPSPLAWPAGCRFHPRCSQAMETCKSEEPALRQIEAGHLVACHLSE